MQLVDFEVAKNILSKYKISFPKTVFVLSGNNINKSIKGLKYPLFLKAYGKNILHRIELGGIKEVATLAELRKIFPKIFKIKGVDGILVQEKADGKNLILGMKRDAQFGPVIMVGIGGLLTEILNDVVLRVAPVSETEALKMLTELKGYSYLLGKRDKKVVNLRAVAKIVAALSSLALKETYIKEIDLNPVIANEKTASAVDFKFLV